MRIADMQAWMHTWTAIERAKDLFKRIAEFIVLGIQWRRARRAAIAHSNGASASAKAEG